MIFGPSVTFRARPHAVFGAAPAPLTGYALLESVVPGAEVQGWVNRWTRWRKIPGDWIAAVPAWSVTCALHSAWYVERELRLMGVTVDGVTRSPDCDAVALQLHSDHHREALTDYGRVLCEAAWRRGELTERFMDEAVSYQIQAPAWTSTRPWSMLCWRPGAGKTPGALAAITASSARRIVVLCPAAARKEWRADADRLRRMPTSVEKYSTLQVFRMLPESEQSTTDETWEAYRARMAVEGRREVVAVGLESMDMFEREIRAFAPDMLVFDEIHKFGNAKRWESTADENGGRTVAKAKTEQGRKTRAVSAMDVTQIPSVKVRVALTGTPMDDGRPRRTWAPLDLLSPGGLGPYSSAYARRYCGWRKDEAGYPDDSGASHVPELRARCAPIIFDVPHAESHKAMMGKMSLEVDYLKRAQLGAPDAMKRELRKLAREAQGSSRPGDRQRLREAMLAEAASMKRSIVLARCADFLAGGQKVMVYLSRKEMCHAWGERLSAMSGVQGWVATGDAGPRKVDQMVEDYAMASGAAWLVGTWDAVGESKNGMQCTKLGVVAQFPLKPAQWIQGVGRWDRLDGVGTIVWVPVADNTQDVREIMRLTRRFGPIEQFIHAPELRELGDRLDGTWDDGLEDDLIAKIVKGGALADSDFGDVDE